MSSCRETRRGRSVRAASRVRMLMRTLPVALVPFVVQAQAQAQAQTHPGIGRPATPQEVAAWDIDVRPDFKGLPPGKGSVAQGQDVWEARCASCHGVFGESNEVFSPLVGGTTPEDVKSGRAARLKDGAYPGRTTLMKVPTVSTLWDYVNRAMPWNAPKSLKTDEVYAVVAYMLNLAGVVPDNHVLSNENIAEAQARMPNRNGMSVAHSMWPGRSLTGSTRTADVKAVACMNDCATEPKVASLLPDHARNAHGNLAEQNRTVGPQRGADTTRPAGAAVAAVAAAPAASTATAPASAVKPASTPTAAVSVHSLLQKHTCLACHGQTQKIVGPGLRDIAAKHGARTDAVTYLTGKIRAGGSGVWGAIPMPPQSLPEADAKAIAEWLAAGARP